MKKIYSLILVAASLAVAACQPKELDNIVPDDNPDVKSVKITASIEDISGTKVSYGISDEAIKPAWEVDDELFGFDANGVKFTYVVTEVDKTTGEATIEPKPGTTSYTPEVGTAVYGIYYPGKGVDDISSDGALAIDLAGQSGTLGTLSPAIMCATATVTKGTGGNEIRFKFLNQTAIIGLKKIQVGSGDDLQKNAYVKQIAIEGVVTHGKLSVVEGVLTLTPGTKTSTVYAVPNSTPESWKTGGDGIITFGAEHPVAFAVLPKDGLTPTIYAYTEDAAFKKAFSDINMVAGRYRYASKKIDEIGSPVASLTVGGVTSKYYNVSDAFDAASTSLTDATITLLKSCAADKMLNLDGDDSSSEVTIDLSGNNLQVTANNYIVIINGRNVRLTDSSSGDIDEQGSIISIATNSDEKSAVYVRANSKLTMDGGHINGSNFRALYVYGSAIISGGKIESENDIAIAVSSTTGSSLTVEGNTQISSKKQSIYTWGGQVTINGNVNISSESSRALYCSGATITINNGTFFSNATNSALITSAGEKASITINGGKFSNKYSGGAMCYASEGGTITATGGYYDAAGLNAISNASGSNVYVSGGYFTKPVQTTYAKDSESTLYYNTTSGLTGDNEKYKFTLTSGSSVATVTVEDSDSRIWKFAKLESAIDAANVYTSATSTITLDANITSFGSATVNNASASAVINLNGHYVASTSSPAISAASSLTLTDTGSTGELSTSGATALEVTAGETTVSSGSLVGATNAASVTGGTLKIYNGHFYGGNSSDIANDGGSVEVSGGWFRNTPASFVAGGYEPVSGTEGFNDRDYYYTVATSKTIATVNDEKYGSLAAAIAAANAYSKAADTVKIKIVADDNVLTHNEAIELNNISGKPIVFDLNGHTLSTSTAQFITATGTSIVIIRDSGAQKGKIFSNQYNIIRAETVGSTITIDGCVIESEADASTTGSNAVVYVKRSAGSGTPYPAVVVDNGAKIYSKNQQPAMYASYGKITLNECEVTSGADGEGATYGVFQTAYGTVIVNNGASIYSKYISGTKYGAVHAGSQNGTVTINGGHLSGGYCVTGSSAAKGNVITINGGYFNTTFNIEGQNLSNAKFNGAIATCSETYDHETTKEPLNYGYSIVKAAKIVELDTEYITLAEAVSTANSNTEAESLTIKLLGNHPKDSTVAPFLLNRGTKKVILDLNGCTLRGADSCFIKTTAGAVDIVDSATKKGKIISSAENVVVKQGGSGVLTIDGCTIASTKASNSYNMDAVVYQYNSSSTVNIKNSVIYSTKALTTLSNRGGKMNIENSEISSGTESAGLVTLFNGGTSAKTEITGGCFYNTTTTDGRGLFYIGISGSVGTITVNSGYFYGTKFGRGFNTAQQFSNITLKGGFFNLLPKSESGYSPTIDESSYKLDTDASGSYYHSIIEENLSFTYQVVPSEGEASVDASTSTPVVSLGEARNGGVSF